MTGKEWKARTDPKAMLRQVLLTAGHRKARLLAAAYWECRAAWLSDSKNLRKACQRARVFVDDPTATNRKKMSTTFIVSNADAHEVATTTLQILLRRDLAFPKDALTWYLHEVFGPSVRRPKAKPEWLTSTVVALARGIYDEGAFDRLPILADALMDAGCGDANVLAHCRTATAWEMPEGAQLFSEPAGTHVRGCWVIDMLLGKA